MIDHDHDHRGFVKAIDVDAFSEMLKHESRAVERESGHDIVIVHKSAVFYAVNLKLLFHKLPEFRISHSGLSERVHCF